MSHCQAGAGETMVEARAAVHLRRAGVNDLHSLAVVHAAAFPNGALTVLGHRALMRYYKWQLLGPHDSAAAVALVGGKCAGFYFGGVFRGATAGFLRQNRLFLTGCVLARPWLLTDQFFRGRFSLALRVLRLKSKPNSPKARPEETGGRSFGILSIAVDPEFQGMGVGKLLMEDAEAVARRQGFERMHLTVHPNNAQAIRFYEKLNWRKSLYDGVWSGSMLKVLS